MEQAGSHSAWHLVRLCKAGEPEETLSQKGLPALIIQFVGKPETVQISGPLIGMFSKLPVMTGVSFTGIVCIAYPHPVNSYIYVKTQSP